MTERLGPMLDQLLGSTVYGREIKGRPTAPTTHGVFLFSEDGEPLYVGRTGKTERSVKAGKSSSSGFRARLARASLLWVRGEVGANGQHAADGSAHDQGSLEEARRYGGVPPPKGIAARRGRRGLRERRRGTSRDSGSRDDVQASSQAQLMPWSLNVRSTRSARPGALGRLWNWTAACMVSKSSDGEYM
jgi:hypothetical protein